MSKSCVAALLAAVAFSSAASAQLVVGNDHSTGQLWVIDVTSGSGTRHLVSGSTAQIRGAAADENSGTLYWLDSASVPQTLYRAAYTTAGALTPVSVGVVTVGGTNVAMDGLAFDTVANKLYAYRDSGSAATEGFCEVNTTDATCTLVGAGTVATAADFTGIDYDPGTDAFYATNDLTTAPFGRGLWRINKPLTAPTFTFLTAYPGTDTDVDGLAVGGGRAYLVNDNAAHYVYNLSTSSYEADVPSVFTSLGGESGGAWAPGLLATSGANIGITIADSPDPLVVPLSNTITYTVTVTNTGPDAANNVAVSGTLPGNVAFSSITPPGNHSAGNITASMGTIAALGSSSFDVVVTYPGSPPDSVSFTLNATTTSSDPSSANNTATATTTVRAPQTNVGVTLADPACGATVGSTFDYTVNVTNAGPETANNVTVALTLPSGSDAAFVSSVPSATPSSGVLTVNLGSIAASGSAALTVTMDPLTAGASLVSSITVTADETDTVPGNNSDAEVTPVSPATPSLGHFAVFSTIAANSNSNVAGASQPARFLHNTASTTTEVFGRPFVSADGSQGVMRITTDLPAANDFMIMKWSTAAPYTGEVLVEETVSDLGSEAIETFDLYPSINNSGELAFSGNSNAATTADEVVVKRSPGGAFTIVAREGTATAAGSAVGINATAFKMTNSNGVFFWHQGPTVNTTDMHVLTADGATIVAQEGVLIPTNQVGGTAFAMGNMDTGSDLGVNQEITADGAHYLLSGVLEAGTTDPEVVVVDGAVVLQDGMAIPGVAGTISTILFADLLENGSWIAYGSNGTVDWVVRDGVVLAQTDDPITTGNTETWDDTTYAQTFFIALGNTNGDYVIAAATSDSDVLSNSAYVLNGTTVLIGENDPVDLNGDGIFNDDAYAQTFRDDRAFLTNDALWLVTNVRPAASWMCGTNTKSGDALLRIPLPPVGPVCDTIDFNQDGLFPDTLDIDDFISVFGGGPCSTDPVPGCADIDFNNDGLFPDTLDIDSFISVFQGGPCL